MTTAIELHRRGLKARIVDPKGGPVTESRALVLNPRSLQLLDSCGAAQRMVEAGLRLQRMNIYDGGKRRFGIELSNLPGGKFMLMLPQARTEEILAELLAEVGVEIEWGTRLERVDRATGGCVLAAESGQVESVRVDLVVGADGARSTVREQAGIGFDGVSRPGEWGLADLRLRTPLAPDESHAMRDGSRLMALFPIGGGRFRLIGTDSGAVEALRSQLDVEEVSWRSTFRISARQVANYSAGRVHLAGDAAHLHSPLGGRGMNLGIEDACWLAWMAAEDRLDGYSAQRYPVGRQVVQTVDAMTRLLTGPQLLGDIGIRVVAPLATRITAVQRRALHNFAGLSSPDPPWR